MFYLAKIIQSCGLLLVLIDFIRKFPNLMSPRILVLGILIFFTGWIIERFLLKR